MDQKATRWTFRAVMAAIYVAAFVIGDAYAAPVKPEHRRWGPKTELSSVPLDGSGDPLSFTLATDGYALAIVTINHDAHTSSNDIGMTCTQTPDGGTTNAILQSLVVASGAATSYDASWTKAISGTKIFPWRVDVLGYKSVTCTLTSTGAAASDTVTVKTTMVTQ